MVSDGELWEAAEEYRESAGWKRAQEVLDLLELVRSISGGERGCGSSPRYSTGPRP